MAQVVTMSAMPIAAGENSYNVNISLTMELINKQQGKTMS